MRESDVRADTMLADRGRRIAQSSRAHILTVSVEEYFHAGSLTGAVRRKHWDRFESRLERNIDELLALLEPHGHRATFFVLGCVADRQPALLRRIAAGGHEIAASGYWPEDLRDALPDKAREDLRRARGAIEDAIGTRVFGYRTSRAWLDRRDLWFLDLLIEEGFTYDSSVNPVFRRFAREPHLADIAWHPHSCGHGGLWEIPITTASVLGYRLPVTGGNYARQLPHTVLKHVVAALDRTRRQPMVFYVMPWELDRGQPHVTALSRLASYRHYRNLGKAKWVLQDHGSRYRFQSVATHLQLESSPVTSTARVVGPEAVTPPASGAPTPITVVVPLYNEEANIDYLCRTLLDVRRRFAPRYHVHFVLVDDGSTDGTKEALAATFTHVKDCDVLTQPRNAGVAAALLRGIAHAPTDIVCTIDCDCSYDPDEFTAMLPLIEHADIVSASPYHPQGRVLNVPGWRLVLSKTLSRLYTVVLGRRLYTFTSCCRVYRKHVVAGLHVENGGFLGVAEMLINAILNGATVVEHPATLESRLFGESKMKIVRTIGGHIGLLWRLARQRARKAQPARARKAALL